jgi:hypothetical protein
LLHWIDASKQKGCTGIPVGVYVSPIHHLESRQRVSKLARGQSIRKIIVRVVYRLGPVEQGFNVLGLGPITIINLLHSVEVPYEYNGSFGDLAEAVRTKWRALSAINCADGIKTLGIL